MNTRALPGPVMGMLLAGLLFSTAVRAQTPQVDDPHADPHADTCTTDNEVSDVLDRLIRAHEQGQVEVLEHLLDDRLPGHLALLDASTRERQTQTRTKIHVQNLQLQCAPQAASISFGWEKRALLANNLRAVLASGSTSILLARRVDQGRARWQVVSISEPNPFWQRSTAPVPVPAMPADPVEPVKPVDLPPSPGRSPASNG